MSLSMRNWMRNSTAFAPAPVQAVGDNERRQEPSQPQPQLTSDMPARQQPEMEERRGADAPGRWRFSRSTIPSFFGGRRDSQQAPPQQQQQQAEMPRPTSSHYSEVESPKTPRFALGMPPLPSTRLHLPNLVRTWSHGTNGPPSRPGTSRAAMPPLIHVQGVDNRPPSLVDGPMFPEIASPRAAHIPDRPRRSEETSSGESTDQRAESGHERRRHRHRHRRENETEEERRQRRRERHRRRRARERRQTRPTPKHYLGCIPYPQSKHVRTQLLKCFVSGMFLLGLLITYLILFLTNNMATSEFTVLLVLIMLFAAVIFLHGMVRLCLYMLKTPAGRREHDERLSAEETSALRRNRAAMRQAYAPGGYAIPEQPIRVVLARDEEAAGIESETTKYKPPAYGLWRESVRVDPDRIYWQRNEHPALRGGGQSGSEEEEAGATGARRPPSYASDDGVSYVVEARPRSMAPTTDVPLPPHPSEVGRAGTPPLPNLR
ncbi:hypothetical protein PpBr36_05433 [Pyricularia pennisetigena]|uniref:hypothetical protein n=1 Tax=Pyricularia pennisetigena TaxID=1578925 RepID=UPI001152046C|nr:hypothetical protein PpBr36_05433 [Pyricularia pennisetigena]TLS26703.1 hypothetical protein PpBr36_05433 [Pyricularia pennisetigena]